MRDRDRALATMEQPAPTGRGVDVGLDLLRSIALDEQWVDEDIDLGGLEQFAVDIATALCSRLGVALYEAVEARRAFGKAKYGTALRTNNGRSALVDALQEAIDLSLYLRQARLEAGE